MSRVLDGERLGEGFASPGDSLWSEDDSLADFLWLDDLLGRSEENDFMVEREKDKGWQGSEVHDYILVTLSRGEPKGGRTRMT